MQMGDTQGHIRRNAWRAAVLAAFLSVPVTAFAAALSFDNWVTQATSEAISPVTTERGDYQLTWKAPSGSRVQLKVKVPHPAANAPTVTMGAVPSGADARPYFDTALQQANTQHAGLLKIPTGTYRFNTLGASNWGHWVIQGATDLVIDGQGSTLVFAQNNMGIFITDSRRVHLKNFIIEYDLHLFSLGTMVNVGGTNKLVVDAAYPVTGSDSIGKIQEYDRTAQKVPYAPKRVIIDAAATEQAVYQGSQTYTYSGFSSSQLTGKSFLISHHYYGGTAILIKDVSTPSATTRTAPEDIVLDNITIYSGPGMGIVTYGLKRGLGVWNSRITRKAGALGSLEYDGIHSVLSGGDISIVNNLISDQGDDGINLQSGIMPITAIASDGKTLTLSTYSRFLGEGHKLVFFDNANNILGQGTIVGTPQSLTYPNTQVVMDDVIPGLTTSTLVRDMSWLTSRSAIMSNTIENCNCHGLLVQTPNTLVMNNTFRNLLANAIRVLTNTGNFVEGIGGFNVDISNNSISSTGPDLDTSFGAPWSAITVYGAIPSTLSSNPANKYVTIASNEIRDVSQGCVAVASSQAVTVRNNSCNNVNLLAVGAKTIQVMKSSDVRVEANRTNAPLTANTIQVDSATTSNVNATRSYLFINRSLYKN